MFKGRRQQFHVIAAIAAASILTSCVSQFRRSPSEQDIALYADWLAEKPRTIAVSSIAGTISAKYKKMVQTRYETTAQPYMDSPPQDPFKPRLCKGVECVIALPLLAIFSAAKSGKRIEVVETEEEIDTSSFRAPVKKISAVLGELDLTRSLATQVVSLGRRNTNHEFQISLASRSEQLVYPPLPSQGSLELSFKNLRMISNDSRSRNFRLQIEVTSQIQIQIQGASCVFDGGPYSYKSEPRNIDEWAAGRAQMFRNEIQVAMNVVSEKVIQSVIFDPGTQDSNNCIDRIAVLQRAKNGEPLAQYLYGRDSPTKPEQARWFCIAANNGNAAALYGLARLYHKELPLKQRDAVKAYQYFLLGEKAMPASADYLAPELRKLSSSMSADELAAAKNAAATWKPDPAACPE